jgi:hypothetical protein
VPTFKPLPTKSDRIQDPAEGRDESDISDNSVRVDLKGHTVEELARKANVSQELIESAIAMKKVELVKRRVNAERIRRLKQLKRRHQVMNAPKEYYPVGYDKNFDDNFKSKIDLPTTSFHCGDQKHFPGLYADVELNCMVSEA